MDRIRHITLPEGFLAAGVHCGIKTSSQEDLSLIVGRRAVAASVLTTSNRVVGAPVLWCRRVLPRGWGRVRGIVINSGCANVCTGPRGLRDAEEMAARAAGGIGAEPGELLVASTGVIGRPLPMAKVRRGIDAAVAALGRGDDRAVVRGIMTTDTREKSAVVQIHLGRETTTIAGIAKGAGMIAPALAGPPRRRGGKRPCATMIAVITTDADIAPRPLHSSFRAACERSFNALTIDADQSTSDTALAMASGLAGKAPAGSARQRKFAAALAEVCTELTRAMARDGEGASRRITVRVVGAASDAQARLAARRVAESPLVKTAVHGADPNWGRIAAAVGASGAEVRPEALTVRIGGQTVFSAGRPTKFDRPRAVEHLRGEDVLIEVRLGTGPGRFTAYTCDLSREYIAINAEYHT